MKTHYKNYKNSYLFIFYSGKTATATFLETYLNRITKVFVT